MTRLTRVLRAAGWALAGAVTLAALWLGSWLGLNSIDPAVQVIGVTLFVLGVLCAVTLVSVAAWHWDAWL
ncbi:MAG TPA: hypothetical protein VIV12_22865, partial [Streptosporangiaceae bacterium]